MTSYPDEHEATQVDARAVEDLRQQITHLSRRVVALERQTSTWNAHVLRWSYAAALAVGTVLACGLVFEWDHSSQDVATGGVSGWHLLDYTRIGPGYRDNPHSGWFRALPYLVLVAAVATAFVVGKTATTVMAGLDYQRGPRKLGLGGDQRRSR